MLQVNVWFDIIADMAKEALRILSETIPPFSPEVIDGEIRKLLDLTKEEWKEHWQTPSFTQSFPNLIFRLVSLEARNQYTDEQKQKIYKLGFTSFMELPWIAGGVAVAGRMTKVNQETQLWEKTTNQPIKQDAEPLIRVEIGCLILLGLSLNNKDRAIDLITETYNALPTQPTNKRKTFRDRIVEITTARSPFRQWVKANKLDINNGFEWDSEVTKLGLKLLSPYRQYKLPSEFRNLDLYGPRVIAEYVDYILSIPIEKRGSSDINLFRKNLGERLAGSDFNAYPELYKKLQEKVKTLGSL